MVSLEVGIDARGVVQGSAQAISALNGLSRLTRELVETLGLVSGSMSGFGLVMARVSPILAAASAALSAVSVIMLTMSRNTQQATSEWDKLGESMRRAQTATQAAGMVGLPKAGPMADQAQQQLLALQGALASGQPSSLAHVSSITGVPRSSLLSVLKQMGNESASEAISTGSFISGIGPSGYATRSRNIGEIEVEAHEMVSLFRQSYKSSSEAAAAQSFEESRSSLPPYEGLGRPGYKPFSLPNELPLNQSQRFDGVSMDPARQLVIDRQIANRELQETLRTAMQISDTLADGATNFAFGLSSARDVAVSMLYDIARGLSREAFGSLTKSIVSSFSLTPAQSS